MGGLKELSLEVYGEHNRCKNLNRKYKEGYLGGFVI